MKDLIQDIMSQFQNFDRNTDGDPAIASLTYQGFESALDEIPHDGRLVLVLVEARLGDPLPGAKDLGPFLLQYKGDLRAEGFYSRFIRASVYGGSRAQDGRTVLALREFFRKVVKDGYPNLQGVVLVGVFPSATLVRRTIWKKGDPGEWFLDISPGLIASRSDIVLADLDGNWESVYQEDPVELQGIVAWPDPATKNKWPGSAAALSSTKFSSAKFERKTTTYNDIFWIQDDNFKVLSESPNQLCLDISNVQRNSELSATDLTLFNPIAQPKIIVSRLNAAYAAFNPNPAVHGDDGTPPLDASGHPQAFKSVKNYDTWLNEAAPRRRGTPPRSGMFIWRAAL